MIYVGIVEDSAIPLFSRDTADREVIRVGSRTPAVWLSWHDHPRSRSLASRLRVPFHAFRILPTGAIRHLTGTGWTIWTLARLRPQVIFLQNSFLLLAVCALYRALRRPPVRIIADCHNKSLRRSLGGVPGLLFWRLKRWSFRSTDAVIVSNSNLREDARNLNPTVLILRDPLPVLAGGLAGPGIDESGRPPVVFVCSFESDEPKDLIFAAAHHLADELDHQVVITGRIPPGALPAGMSRIPGVRTPGFLPRAEYEALLRIAHVVVVLTEDRDCLMCGAYEALAAGRPLVLSDHALLRKYFGTCAEYASHDLDALVAAIRRAGGRDHLHPDYARDQAEFVTSFEREWRALLDYLATLEEGALPCPS